MISKKTLTELFKISTSPCVVILPDSPIFTIIEVNNNYLEATNLRREDLIGKGIFEVFPNHNSNPGTDGTRNLKQSLNTVINTHKSHKMAIHKYDISILGTSKFRLKYWEPENIPLLDEDGQLQMILHTLIDVTQSTISKNEIKESRLVIDKGNEMLLQTENLSKLGRWEHDLTTGKVYWSDNHFLMLGYQPQEFEATFDLTLSSIHPEDRDRIMTLFEYTLKKQKDFNVEFRFITKNKSIINVIIRGKFIFDDNGNPHKIVGVLQDITDIKLAEQAAKKAQEALQKILDLSLDIICTGDELGNFLTTNAACESILGYTPEEFIGKNFSEFVYQDDYTKSMEAQKEMISGIEVTTLENTFIHKDGSLVDMLWSARFDTAEKIVYAVGKNITGLNKSKKEVKEKQDFIEIALENLPLGISINKIYDNKAIWMNKKFTEIYGWPTETLKDVSTFFEKVYPDETYRDEIMARVMQDINSGDKDKMNWEDITITTKNGEQKNVNAKNIPVYEQNLMISTVIDVSERIKARKAIEESNERFEYVTKATFDAIWDWDLVTDTIYWGEGFETIFGHKISALEPCSASWTKNIYPEDLQRITDSYYNIIKSSETNWIEEYRFKKGDGNYSYVINKGIIIRDTSNRAIRIIGAMHDINKQKHEEQRLKLLESVVTNTTDSILITEAEPFDVPGPKILYVNEAFTKMTGYTAEEVIGKTPRILQGPKTDKAELNKLGEALRRWETCEATLLNYKKNGEEFWLNMSISPVANEKGWFTHWVAIERDVTDRKIQEQKLIEISQKLLDTLESIQDGFYTLDDNWNISYWNHEAERISGKNHHEMIGKNIWDVYEGKISKKMYTKFHEAKKQNKPIRLETYSKKENNWFEINAFPSSMGLTIYFKDITERKQNESKLKKINRKLEVHVKELALSNQELEQFAYVASHDLQEPLRMITGFLTQIEKKYGEILDEKGKKYIFFAVDGAKRMRQIILDLLEFSRIGKKDNKLEEINLNSIINEIVLLYQKQIEEKKAIITYENLPTLKSYSTPVKQIFQNLISNSLKYSKSNTNPIINITFEETVLAWKFTIQDNGIGINPEYFDKIFILFQRLHNKDEYSGTGIGLAITKKIVDSLGGQIWVKSEEGIGSAFHFTIPKKQTKKS